MKKNYLNAQTQVVEMEISNAIMGTSMFGIDGQMETDPENIPTPPIGG